MNRRISSPHESFVTSVRLPGETLYDYLLRCRVEMTGRIKLLETVRDGAEMIHFEERARARRHMIVLALGEAGFAAAGVILLDWCGIAASMATPLLAAAIGLCALFGAILSVIFLAVRQGLLSSLRAAGRRIWRFLCWIMLGDDDPSVGRLPPWIDATRPETIDAYVEERVALNLEVETFLWRSQWLIVQIAIILSVFCGVEISRGESLLGVLENAALIAIVCFVVGGLFVLVADFVSTGLARLGRWWRRR